MGMACLSRLPVVADSGDGDLALRTRSSWIVPGRSRGDAPASRCPPRLCSIWLSMILDTVMSFPWVSLWGAVLGVAGWRVSFAVLPNRVAMCRNRQICHGMSRFTAGRLSPLRASVPVGLLSRLVSSLSVFSTLLCSFFPLPRPATRIQELRSPV